MVYLEDTTGYTTYFRVGLNQTVAYGGDYSIVASGTTGDGIEIYSQGRSIGDIEVGESFSIKSSTTGFEGTLTYLDGVGLVGSNGIYTGTTQDDDRNSGALKVNLANLTNSSNYGGLLAPEDSVLAVDATLTGSGKILDSKNAPTTTYGDFSVSGSSVNVTSNGSIAGVSSISVGSGYTSANFYDFTETELDEITFIAADSGATFKVTELSGSSFTVSGTNSPTITGATKITLSAGTITATKDQEITLGDTGKTFQVTNDGSVVVNYDDKNKIWTATGTGTSTTPAKFTFGGKEYEVNNSTDGITFTLGSDGNVSIGGVTKDGEIFSYNGQEYSLKSGLGLLTSDGDAYKFLSGFSDSIAATSLAGADWTGLITIASGAAASIPSTSSLTSAVLMNSSLNYNYGTIDSVGAGVWSLSAGARSGMLSSISLGADAGSVSMAGVFGGKTIAADTVASFTVTDDSTNGFVVSISGGNASVSGATAASLVSGSLTADTNIFVNANSSVIAATKVGDDGKIVVVNDGNGVSVGGFGVGESINVNGSAYEMTKLGVTDSSNKLLAGTKPSDSVNYTLDLSSLSGDWQDMIGVGGGLSVDSASKTGIIVNGNKDSLFGALSSATGGYTFSDDGGDTWTAGTSNAVTIDNTTLTLPETYASINAVKSGAVFSISASDTDSIYTVTDSAGGASVSGADSITQTAGIISLSSAEAQSISASDSVISFAGLSGSAGDGIINVSVDGTKVSIGGLDEGESFNVGGETYSVTGSGKLLNGDKIWTNSVSGAVDVASLGSGWLSQITISGGKLEINTTNASIASVSSGGAYVVDSSDSDKVYGKLASVSSGGYELTTDGATASLTAIDLAQITTGKVGAKAAVPFAFAKDFANVPFTAGTNQFIVTDNSNDFTIKYQPGYPKLSVSDATKVSLTAGEITAKSETQTIATGNYSISAADGLNIANDGSSVSIGNIGVSVGSGGDNDGKFTVIDASGTTNYQYYSSMAGLAITDGTNITGVVGSDFASKTLTLGGKDVTDALAPTTGGALDLSNGVDNDTTVLSTTDATATNVTKLAELDYDTISGGGKTLDLKKATGYANEITSVTLEAANVEFTTDFAIPTVTTSPHDSESLTYKINGVTYTPDRLNESNTQSAAPISVTVIEDGSSLTSALTDGTVILGTSDSVKVSSDGGTTTNTIAATDGDGMTVKVDGTDVTIDGLANGDTFSVDDTDYEIMSDKLINTTGEYLWQGTFTGSITLAQLASTNETDWLKIQPIDGNLEIKDDLFKDGDKTFGKIDLYNKTTGDTYGTLTKTDTGYTLTKADGDTNLTSITTPDGTKFAATPTDGTFTITSATETAALTARNLSRHRRGRILQATPRLRLRPRRQLPP